MITIVHGKALAKKMTESLINARKQFEFTPTLTILYTEGDAPSEKYVNVKEQAAIELDVKVNKIKIDGSAKTEDVLKIIKDLNNDESVDSIIVQLPLPSHINKSEVLNAIDIKKDVDVLSADSRAKFAHEESRILPPIVSAVQYILEAHGISLLGKDVLVLGHGFLVGGPLAQFARQCGGRVTVLDNPVRDLNEFTKNSQVIICGTGIPSLLMPTHVNEGVVIIDAGMSIVDGKLTGDVHPDVAMHSALFTPTPNGVGPLVVSSLMKNVLIISKNNRKL